MDGEGEMDGEGGKGGDSEGELAAEIASIAIDTEISGESLGSGSTNIDTKVSLTPPPPHTHQC